MSSIFQIEEELQEIFDSIEANEGEITEELAKELEITEENFKRKVENYTNAIKGAKFDIACIKDEKERLDKLLKRKQKLIDNLSNILVAAIERFGDTKKSGSKYFNYGSGEVSIRKTQSVEIYDGKLDSIQQRLKTFMSQVKDNNQIEVIEFVDNDLFNDIAGGDFLTQKEIENIKVTVETTVSLNDLINNDTFNKVKYITETDDFDIKVGASKIDMKTVLKEDGACMPHLAKLSNNSNLLIK